MALNRIVPYCSAQYADHALRETGIDTPNQSVQPTDEHIDILIKAAEFMRDMVSEMDQLEEMRGYITFTEEEEKKQEDNDGAAKMINTEGEIDKMKTEAGE